MTGRVVMLKVAYLAPAGTATLVAESVATAVLLLVIATIDPPAGAGPVRFTVPSELIPPATDTGDTPTELRPAGLSVSTADLVTLA